MYTEEYEERGYSLKKILIKFLIVIAIVVIIIGIWLKLSSSSSNNNRNKGNETSLSYTEIYNKNVESIKESTISYYKEDLLPEEEGKYETLTLKEMLDKKMIDTLIEDDNDKLDYEKSYIKITNTGQEFILKINIKTEKREKSELIYLGHYNYCTSYICERDELLQEEEEEPVNIKQSKDDIEENEVIEDKNNSNTSKSEVLTENETLYKYVRVTPAKLSNWSNWSNWQKSNCEVKDRTCQNNDTNCLIELKTSKKYDEQNEPICYQSIRRRTKISSSYTTTRWSKYNDTDLLNSGWNYTGETKTK